MNSEWVPTKNRLPELEDDPWGKGIFLALDKDLGPVATSRELLCDMQETRYTHWQPISPPPKESTFVRSDCRHYRSSGDWPARCEANASAGHIPICVYGASWCKYEAEESTVRSDCKHYARAGIPLSDAGVCLANQQREYCLYGASWCKYEPKEVDPHELFKRYGGYCMYTMLEQRITRLEKRIDAGEGS